MLDRSAKARRAPRPRGALACALLIAACGQADPVARLEVDVAAGSAPLDVVLDARGSLDPEDSPGALTARFDADGDGAFEGEATSALTFAHRYLAAGRYEATVEISTADGRTARATRAVVVAPNRPPVAAITASPGAGPAPLEVTLDASGSSDPDQDPATLEVRFDLDGDGAFDTPFSTARTARHLLQTPGPARPRVEVRDRGGLVASATLDPPVEVGFGADLDGDTDRDGDVDDADEAEEDLWSARRGVAVLANVDDDDGDGRVDGRLDTVDGDADLLDLARLVVRRHAELVAGDRATIAVEPPGAPLRVFARLADGSTTLVRRPGQAEGALDVAALAAGDLELLVESGAPRSATFDGRATLRLAIARGDARLEDAVAVRVAPVVFTDNTRPAGTLYVMQIDDRRLGPNGPLMRALRDHLPASVTLRPVDEYRYAGDRWVQDAMQPGYQSMPGREGAGPHVLPTFLQTERPTGDEGLEPLLPAELLGPDLGYVYAGRDRDTSLSYGGNLEVAPPHAAGGVDYPFGRLLVGGGDGGLLRGRAYGDRMADRQRAFLDAQEIQGPALELSSEWLAVGHVDEVFLVVAHPAAPPGARPWKVLLASPALARAELERLLASGLGDAAVFAGREEETTVAELLDDGRLMAFNEAAQARIDSIREVLAAGLALGAEDFAEVPVLYAAEYFDGLEFATALSPGIQNLAPTDDVVFAPAPEGPREDGVDVWEAHAARTLTALGLTARFVDVFESYHVNLGEVHCGTAITGAPYAAPWWSTPAAGRDP